MKERPNRLFIFFTFIIFAILVCFSTWMLVQKRDSLQFHTRDYNYFMEQAARITDNQMTKKFALNIEGYNMLGLQGIEGTKSLLHAIHNEYFRYTYVALYWIFQNTLVIYIFYSIVFLFPIIYLALQKDIGSIVGRRRLVFFTLLFVLFPAFTNTITADLRPRMLFVSAWCLIIFSIQLEKPFWEKFLFFGFLLFIREEGIILGLFIILLNFIKMKDRRERWLQTFVFVAADIFAFGLFLAFMNWGEYFRVDFVYDPIRLLNSFLTQNLSLVLCGFALIVAAIIVVWKKHKSQFNNLLLLLVYFIPVAITLIQVIRDASNWYNYATEAGIFNYWDFYLQVISASGSSLFFYMILVFLVILFEYLHKKYSSILQVILFILYLVFLATTFVSTPKKISEMVSKIPNAKLVWEFKTNHDRYKTNVLLDYATYQAFYDFNKVIVYNRLPSTMVLPDDRFMPKSIPFLIPLLQERMEYAVISRESKPTVEHLASLAGLPISEVAANDDYIIFKFR